jgi:hypothetical protein
LIRLSSIFLVGSLLASCASTPPIQDQARETADLGVVAADTLELAASLGPRRVLLVTDIDNTLLAMPQGLGSDQWYDWQKHLAESNPCDPLLAGPRFPVQGALYFASTMRPTQADASAQFQRVQQAGVPVIALTSRGVDYRLATFRELRRNGFSFAYSSIGAPGGFAEDYVPAGGSRPARYEDGVVLSSGQHKGTVLRDLIDRTDTPMPAVIVFVDDKQANIDAVNETFSALGVPVHSWRYSGEDLNVARFDTAQAARLWDALRPALLAIQDLLGPQQFALPAAAENCVP